VSRNVDAYWLGRIGYEDAHALQQKLVDARIAGDIADTLLLLEHDAVITLGRGAKNENVLERTRVPVIETGRGGDVTFHGPGQLVAYPIFDLKPDRQDVRRYVRALAEVMIRLARDRGVEAGVVPGDAKLIGVWVDENDPTKLDPDAFEAASMGVPNGVSLAKLGAIGVRLSRWVTMHGFAFNVTTDLSGFGMIVPCGIKAHGVTSLSALGKVPQGISVEEVGRASLRHFGEVFESDVTLREGRPSIMERA
jgi:lipoyl(octanoyl) transferase